MHQFTPFPARARLLILALIPFYLAAGFLQIVIGAWLVTVGFTAVQAGTLLSVQGVATLLAAIPLGIVSDVYGRRYLLVSGALVGASALFAFSQTTDFRELVVFAAVLGAAQGATLTTWNALLADMTDTSNRNKVFSFSFVTNNVTTGIGLVIPGIFPFVGGAMGATNYSLHRETLSLLGAMSFVTPVILSLLLRKQRETRVAGKRWAGFKNAKTILKLAVTWTSIGLGAGFVVPLIGSWFYLRFGVPDSYSGPILAFSGILPGLSAVASPWLASKFGQVRAILLTTGSSMVFMLSMAFVPVFSLGALVYVVRATLMNMSGPLTDSFSMSIFPAEQRGLVSALGNVVWQLPNSFGTYFGGLVLEAGLLQLPFFIASVLYTVGLSAFYLFFGRRAAKLVELVPSAEGSLRGQPVRPGPR